MLLPSRCSARTAAVCASWSALKAEVLDWPATQLSLRGYLGPLREDLFFVVGVSGARDSKENVTSAGVFFNILYMLPVGDRLVPFVEGGVAGRAMRMDVMDRTRGSGPVRKRTTFVRGGYRAGAGLDLAVGGSWSVVLAVSRTWLRSADLEYVERNGEVRALERETSFWELPRLGIVFWY